MKRNENLSKLALEYRSAFNLRVFFHHQCVCVPRAPALPLALLCLCWAAGLGRAVQRAVMPWIDLSLVQTIQNLKCCHSRSGGGGEEDTYAPSIQQEEQKAAAVSSPNSSEGNTVFGCTPNNIAPHSLPLWPSTELSLVQELKWSACQSPGTWLRAPSESDKAANRRSWDVSLQFKSFNMQSWYK